MGRAGIIGVVLCAIVLPFAAARSMIELTTVDDGPVSLIPSTVQYNWSDTSPSGIARGTPDIPASDPRLQPAPEGYPEQVSVTYYGPTSVRFGWATGQAQTGYGALEGFHDSTGSNVQLGLSPSAYTDVLEGTSSHYDQIYYGFSNALNYTSPKLHSVVVEDLTPNTSYFYRVGDLKSQYWSEEYNFTTPPAGPSYPLRFGLVADVGQTDNSSDTFNHLAASEPQVVLFIGDLSYADNYEANGTLYPWNNNISYPGEDIWIPFDVEYGTFQPRWDKWARLAEPVTSSVPFLFTVGNHEMEPQSNGRKFVSYNARYPSNYEASGSSNALWYSVNVGPAHIAFITSYADYDQDSAQYKWLAADLANVNRTETPWLIVGFHAPWYTSYRSHYQEANCQRLAMEPLLFENGVDLVLNGHVHAYERTFPVYNYTLNDCGPVHLTLGDGGNIEKLAAVFADYPGYCPAVPVHGPSYQPEVCNQLLYDGEFCSTSQPEWSAFREPSFGHSVLDILNDTHAHFAWYRNQDADTSVADEVILVRNPEECGIPLEGLNSQAY
ncbi:Purple acid phosphatase 15 [Auxenochlorella protothecoides]|uniref:Purple acid phosphatase n=1 Tax=Auxenochlorella protothecoides TaxID=3075 RepID=A0A087SN34_AUXPR|nr:Purple acid phosphatase 15 [Auxenochlorella protothecoides]KFM27138.1 Purple acid phosphatase 15 [Auxenochlorella protothecoides]